MKTHIDGVNYLEENGIKILGFVVDGFWSFYRHYYTRYDIQMCQKHMADIVRRYTTLNPKLEASKELKKLVDRLSSDSKHVFGIKYDNWLRKWRGFLSERSHTEDGKWAYTHGRLRSAITSLKKYYPYLFTFERNKWIPNTNNSIEGFNSGLKSAIELHRGLRDDRKVKLIHFYLKERSRFSWGRK